MSSPDTISKEASITQLFGEVDRFARQEEYDKTLRSLEKILRFNPEDHDAIKCKSVSLIRLEKYQIALELLTQHLPENQVAFLKAYCLYRLNLWDEVLKLTQKYKLNENEKLGLLNLEAQSAYRIENFLNSLDIYHDILEKLDKKDDAYDDALTNVNAVKSAFLFNGGQLNGKYKIVDITTKYELAYNSACGRIGQGDLKQGEKLLNIAQDLCHKSLSQEKYSEREIEHELAPILVQLGYVYQLQGRLNEAIDIYKRVMKTNSADLVVLVIASNNLVAASKDNSEFDFTRKLRTTSPKILETRLFRNQRQSIAFNEALLLLYNHKYSACQDAVRKLLSLYPENDDLFILLAAIPYLQKAPTKAIQDLEDYARSHPNSLPIHFALIQLQLSQFNISGSLAALEAYLASLKDEKDRYQPALVGILVWLYEQSGLFEESAKILENASSFSKKSFQSVQSSSILKHAASFKLRTRRFLEAAQDYEELVKANPQDPQAFAGLITAYSYYDILLAEKYRNSLKVFDRSSSFDIEFLEKTIPGVKNTYKKADAHSELSGKLTKKKRKRKPLLPKTLDANVLPDPERWLPKRERSTYKVKGKRKQNLMKGSQGTAIVGGGFGGTGSANIAGKSPLKLSSELPPATPTPPIETSVKAKTGTGGSDKSKKKKKKGGKW